MPKCLGIYIEDDVIKYAKVDKNKDILKVDASNVVFYERGNVSQTIEKIIRETFSTKDTISINISNELYNYFDVFAALKQSDKNKSVDLDFELLCSEKGYNKDSLESRYLYTNSKENSDKMRVIHIAANKEGIHKRLQEFTGSKVVSATPITTSIFNLLELGPKEENVVIVNIEKDTKVTTIIGGEVYNIDIIPEGMGQILDNINKIENSMQKSYECCKNTTIYTQETQELQMDGNEHLEDIMPVLYKIVSEVRKISEATIGQISKVYITGLGTAINNVDLYFQEYIPNSKCELLKPFFLENASIKIPIKDYIEVNSAISLALEGLAYGKKELNFKGKKGGSGLNKEINADSVKGFFKALVDPRKQLEPFDKTMLRFICCICVGIIGYSAFSTTLINQIDEKRKDIKNSLDTVNVQIDKIDSQTGSVTVGETNYNSLIEALTKTDDTNDVTDSRIIIEKYAIPNLLNRIAQNIPQQVKVTSIKNTTETHIVIQAEAAKYEQLGFFRAVLSTEGTLKNVKSTSGSKSGDIITITIEGDLP